MTTGSPAARRATRRSVAGMVESLVEALEREHREIDAGIEAYRETADVESLRRAAGTYCTR